MAKKQTRRSISVSRRTYDRIKAYAETNNTSMSAVVQRLITRFLDSEDARETCVVSYPEKSDPVAQVEEAIETAGKVKEAAERIFTF